MDVISPLLLNVAGTVFCVIVALYGARSLVPTLKGPHHDPNDIDVSIFHQTVSVEILGRMRSSEIRSVAIVLFGVAVLVIAMLIFENLLRQFLSLQQVPRDEREFLPSLLISINCLNLKTWIVALLIITIVLLIRSSSIIAIRAKAIVQYFTHHKNHPEIDGFFLSWIWDCRDSLPVTAKGSVDSSVRKIVTDVWNGNWHLSQHEIALKLCNPITQHSGPDDQFTEHVNSFVPRKYESFMSLCVCSVSLFAICAALNYRFCL